MPARASVLACLACAAVAHAHIPHDDVRDLAVSPAFPLDPTVLIVIRGDLLISDDGGWLWRRSERGLCADAVRGTVLSPQFGEDRVAWSYCVRGHLHRSVDAGSKWHAVGSPGTAAPRQVLTLGSRRLVAVADDGRFWRSADAGFTWQQPTGAPRDLHAIVVAESDSFMVAVSGRGQPYISDDAGSSWQQLAIRGHDAGRLAECFPTALLPVDSFPADGCLAVGTERCGIAVLCKEDGEFRIAAQGLAGHHVTSLAAQRFDDVAAWLATTWQAGVYRSMDGGRTWHAHDAGLSRHPQADISELPHFGEVVARGRSAFVATFCGVGRADGDGRWRLLEPTLHHIIGLAVTLEEDRQVVGIATYGGGAYLSEDGGATWVVHNHGLTNPRLGALVMSPAYASDGTLFAAHYRAMLRSTDRGRDWYTATVGEPTASLGTRLRRRLVRAVEPSSTLSKLFDARRFKNSVRRSSVLPKEIAVSPGYSADRTVFAAMAPQGVIRSTNGGETFDWVWHGSHGMVRSIVLSPEFPRDGVLFAGAQDDVHRSKDRGTTWEPVGRRQPLEHSVLAISPDFARDETVYAGNVHGLFVSHHGGDRWVRVEQVVGAVSAIAVSPALDDGHDLLLQLRGAEPLLGRSRGGGLSLVRLQLGYTFTPFLSKETAPTIRFSPGYARDRTIYAAAFQDLLRSSDGGTTWQVLPRPRRYEADLVLDDFNRYPIATEGQWTADPDLTHSGSRALRGAGAVHLDFIGSGVSWIGARGPEGGVAEVLVDGQRVARVDTWASVRSTNLPLYSVVGLEPGPHRITIQLWPETDATGPTITIDAFDVTRTTTGDPP